MNTYLPKDDDEPVALVDIAEEDFLSAYRAAAAAMMETSDW